MAKCSQCDKDAIEKYKEHYLCLNCLERISEINFRQNEARDREILYAMQSANAAIEDMNVIGAAVGVPAQRPPYDLSVFRKGNRMNYNSFNLRSSVVGAISTAEVGSMQVSLEGVSCQENGLKVGDSIRSFMEAVLSCQDLDANKKNEILEQLGLLSEQAALPTTSRKSGLIKAALSGVKESASTIGLLATTWEKVEPIIKSFLGV
ncbi:hypothetical protein [Methylomagnum sp.]